MARFQILDRPAVLPVLGPVVLSADNTPAALDTRQFDNVQLLVDVGVGGITFDATNKIEVKLRHGDTTTVGDHTAVTATDVKLYDATEAEVALVSGGIIYNMIAAHAAIGRRRVDYVGARRYLSVLVDFSGTHGAGTPFSIDLLLSAGPFLPARH